MLCLDKFQQKLTKKIQKLDAQPYSIQLNYKKRHEYKSLTGGLISCMFYIAAIVIVALNLYYFVTQKQMMFQQISQSKNFSSITLERERFGLIILINIDQNHTTYITQQNQQQFGIRVQVQYSDDPSYNPNKTKAVNCHWNSSKYEYDFTGYLCFPEYILNTSLEKYSMDLKGRSDVIYAENFYRRLGWLVYYTPKNQTQKLNITARFVFINDLIDPKQPEFITGHSIRRIYIRDGDPLPKHQLQHINIFFKKLEVYTDTSLLFFKQIENLTSNFFDEQLIQTIFTTNEIQDNKIIWIKMKRSLYTIKYFRRYKKIQTFLAQTFGVIGLASFIFLIYKGYNKWCFTQKQLVPGEQRQKTNIFKYYLYILQNFRKISPFSQHYSEFQKNLDINRILKRIDKLESKYDVSSILSQGTHNRQNYESLITAEYLNTGANKSKLIKNSQE